MAIKSIASKKKKRILAAQSRKAKKLKAVARIKTPKLSAKTMVKSPKKTRQRVSRHMRRGPSKKPAATSKVSFTRNKKVSSLTKTKAASAVIDSNVNENLSMNGVSQMRPEIIMQMNFLPLFSRKNTVSGPYDFYELQKSARFLYQENSSLILDKLMEDPVLEDEILALLKHYNRIIKNGKMKTRQLGYILFKVNMIRRDFDFKDQAEIIIERLNKANARKHKARKRYLAKKAKAMSAKAEAAEIMGSSAAARYRGMASKMNRRTSKMSLHQLDELQTLWTDIMGFSTRGWNNFSNTKLLAQLIADMKNTMFGCSPHLLSGDSQARKGDVHPFTVSTDMIGETSGFFFTMENYKASTFKPLKLEHYKELLQELPDNPWNRIKLLCSMVSKEFKFSLATTRTGRMNRLEAAGVEDPGNEAFEDIFGDPSEILEGSSLDGLSNFLVIETEDGTSYLPFEKAYVRSNDDTKLYEPGFNFLGKPILQGPDLLDVSNLVDYYESAADTLNTASRACSALMNAGRGSGAGRWHGTASETLVKWHFDGDDFFDLTMRQVIGSKLDIKSMLADSSRGNTSEAFIGLLYESSYSPKLRHLLFKYALLLEKYITAKQEAAVQLALDGIEGAADELEKEQAIANMMNPNYAKQEAILEMNALFDSESEDIEDDIEAVTDLASVTTALSKKAREIGRAYRASRNSNKSGKSKTRGSYKSKSKIRTPFTDLRKKNSGKDEHKTILLSLSRIVSNLKNPESDLAKKFYVLIAVFYRAKSLGKKYANPNQFRSARRAGSDYMEAAVDIRKQIRGATGRGKAAKNAANKMKNRKGKKRGKARRQAQRAAARQQAQATTLRRTSSTKLSRLGAAAAAARALAHGEINGAFVKGGDDKFGSSRWNRVNERTVQLMLFEVFVTLVTEMFHARSIAGGTKLRINVTRTRASIYAAWAYLGEGYKIDKYLENVSSAEEELYGSIKDGLDDVGDCLDFEKQFMHKGFDTLSVFMRSIYVRTRRTAFFFNLDARAKKYRRHRRMMKNLMSHDRGQLILSSLTKSQQHLRHYMSDNLDKSKPKKKELPIPSFDLLTFQQTHLLEETLKLPMFRKGRADNLNLLTVGIPQGLLQYLKYNEYEYEPKAVRYDEDDTGDLIELVVWKRDVQHDDLVFLPRTYTFDMSRFLSPSDSYEDIKPSDTFDDMLRKKLKFIDYGARGRKDDEGSLLEDVIVSEEYMPLYKKGRATATVMTNVVSEMLKLYIRIMTGLNVSEQEFHLSRELFGVHTENMDERAAKLVDKIVDMYLEDEEIETEEQLAAHQAMINQLTFLTKSVIFKAQDYRNALMSPTLFDRIFCIPVDPDDFQIDIRKTASSRSGRDILRTALLNRKVRKRKVGTRKGRAVYGYYMKARRPNEGDIAIFEYFVSMKRVVRQKMGRKVGRMKKTQLRLETSTSTPIVVTRAPSGRHRKE